MVVYMGDGHAVWRFTLPNQAIIYINSHREAWKYYYRNLDSGSFKIEARTRQGWIYVASYVANDTCHCGRSFTMQNGEIFRHQDPPIPFTVSGLSEVFNSPVLCVICYYKGELKAGRWAPKMVKRELGLET